LDYAFDRETKQITIYEKVGKPTVEDVLNGYNGTIIAYGQTGSGKTYTMFGPDIYDEEVKGIIPRAAYEIFQKWETVTDLKEVVISCSILEIYKEDLRDLLADEENMISSSELKIKEFPDRGIWVEGLSEMPIGSEEELMYWLHVGESRRVWAETCHNAVSSRSHTLVMLEVRQILTNGSEKRGLLNLVDLAGSEKVGRSGAQGDLFVEGTKINLSLSTLGNVIHALTSNQEHIPYRESKLTRLLQESLGGNYKTTLIVTCAPHSSESAESISTLRFAQRAKNIKNKVKINIKNSPEQLLKIIEELKEELRSKNDQMTKMMTVGTTKSRLSTERLKLFPDSNKAKNAYERSTFSNTNNDQFEQKYANKYFPGETLTIKLPTSSTVYDITTDTGKLAQELLDCKKQIESLMQDKAEAEEKTRQLELQLVDEKKRALVAETRITELENIIESNAHKENKENLQEKSNEMQNVILSNQIKALEEALNDTEENCFRLLKEKKEKLTKETIELHSLDMIDYVNKSTLQTSFTTKWVKDLGEIGLDVQGTFIGPKNLFNQKSELFLEEKKLMSTSKYAETLDSAVIEGKVSPETIIYLLKNQLIDAAILNHNLQRVVSLLAWKLYVEKSAASLKNEINAMLQKTVNSLESLLTKTSTKHQTMKRKLEKLDYEITQLKLQQISHRSIMGSFVTNSNINNNRPKVRKPIKRLSALKHTAFGITESRILKIRPAGLITPMGMISSHSKELRWDDVCRSRVKEEMSSKFKNLPPMTEEDEQPKTAEMNEDDEKKIQEIVAGKKSPIRKLDLMGEENTSNYDRHQEIEHLEFLEHGLRDAQIDLAWHKALTDLLMEELVKTREQANSFKKQISEIKVSSEQVVQDENRNWKMITDSLKVFFIIAY